MNRQLRTLLVLPALLLLTACQTRFNFDKEWRLWSAPTPAGAKAFPKKKEPIPHAQSPWDGRWAGHWTSEKHREMFSGNASTGEVRCILTFIDPYRYRANFSATWKTVFRGEYLTTLYGKPRGKTLRVKGHWPVSPIFGGDYHYEGTITPTRFSIRYDSKYDSGTMELRRVQP